MTEMTPTANANIHSIMAQIPGYEFDLMTVRSFDYWAAEKKIDMDLAEETANSMLSTLAYDKQNERWAYKGQHGIRYYMNLYATLRNWIRFTRPPSANGNGHAKPRQGKYKKDDDKISLKDMLRRREQLWKEQDDRQAVQELAAENRENVDTYKQLQDAIREDWLIASDAEDE